MPSNPLPDQSGLSCCNCNAPITFAQGVVIGVCVPCWNKAGAGPLEHEAHETKPWRGGGLMGKRAASDEFQLSEEENHG